MQSYRYSNWKKGIMNNTPMTYEDYYEWDKEYRLYEDRIEYIINKYMTSIDRDDIEYPPSEYWESGI